jgi:steroid 5-alpha reductase family enzyme
VEVSDRSYRRLTRFAALSVVDLVALAVAATLPGWDAGVTLIWLLLLPAIGPFQAEVALNPTLDEDDRRRWRIALYVVPWSMTLYWHRYVRR